MQFPAGLENTPFTIFGLKMMVKSGVGKIFVKFLHAQAKEGFGTKKNSDECTYHKWNFKSKSLPVFHFDRVKDRWVDSLGLDE